MTRMWGIHNDTIPADELVTGEFVSIGFEPIGDLRDIGDDQGAMKHQVESQYPSIKAGAIPIWAGCLRRFAFTLKVGDLVVAPNRATSTLNFARVTGDYSWHPDVAEHQHRRPVEWIATDVPRSAFPQKALHEIGAMVTLFEVKKYRSFFEAHLNGSMPLEPSAIVSLDQHEETSVNEDLTLAENEPSAAKAEQHTRDFILNSLMHLEPSEFEDFTADLLQAAGYSARVTQASGDKGVDVIAHRDALGFEGVIKVQCKRSHASQGSPVVSQLKGTLSPGEMGLFVCLGSYTTDAKALEHSHQSLRLLGAPEVIEMTLNNYSALSPRWRTRVPLRQVYVVDRDAEGY